MRRCESAAGRAGDSSRAATGDRRNLVLVTVDSLRADHTGVVDDPGRELTPTLDGLAGEGVAYEAAVAPGPRTPSSVPTTLTGRFTSPIDWTTVGGNYWRKRREHIAAHMRRCRTLAGRLRERGYTTVGLTLNPWTEETGCDAGFDRYVHLDEDDLTEASMRESLAFRTVDDLLYRDALATGEYYPLNWKHTRKWFMTWPNYEERLSRELRDASEPFFLWVFLLDTHQPYFAPGTDRVESTFPEMLYANARVMTSDATDRLPGWVDERLRRSYRDTVRSVDRFLGRLRDDLAPYDPVTVVHADHGEAFGEHGSYGHQPVCYEENLHVPLVVHGAGRGRVERPVSLRRLPAMLVDVADDAYEPGTYATDRVLARTEDARTVAVRGRRWKYVDRLGGGWGRGDGRGHGHDGGADGDGDGDGDGDEDGPLPPGTELYDLDADPGERESVVADRPEVARALGGLVDQFRADHRERGRIATAVSVVSTGGSW